MVIVTGSARGRRQGMRPPGWQRGRSSASAKRSPRGLHLGEDELRARLPGSVEDEIDRRPTSAADDDERLVEDVCVLRPGLFEAMAVDARGRRPRRARLQHEAVLEGQSDEVGQPAVFLRVPCDHEARRVVGVDGHAAVA